MTEPTEPQEPTEPTSEPVDETSIEHWKQMSRKWETRAKENHAKLKEAEPIVSQWKALEEASKTELQRVQEDLAREQAARLDWQKRAVSSHVTTLAAADFADPSDALAVIKPEDYLGAGGEIDEGRLKADLAAALEKKPHWRKPEGTPGPRVPAPNPAQGSGVDGRAANDPAQQFAALIQQQLNR